MDAILQDYLNWGIIGPEQSNINDINWTGAYDSFKEKRNDHYKLVDDWYRYSNITEESEFYTIDAYNEWLGNKDIFDTNSEIMWQSLIGKSLTQEQYDDYINSLSNLMESLKLLFMVVDRDPFTEYELNGFKTLWSLDVGASLTLPLPEKDDNDNSLTYNFTIFWGDGTSNVITSYNSSDITHTYTNGGYKTVNIVGVCEGWSFGYNSTSSDRSKLIEVLSWGDSNLFQGFKYLRGGFSGANNLTSLPDGSDGYGTSIPATSGGCLSFDSIFQECNLSSIPSGLFDNHLLVTSFRNTFIKNNNIVSIPSGLFDKNTIVTDFAGTFGSCDSLTTIPTGLFDKNTIVTDFAGTFGSCDSLTTIPTGLFRQNTSVTSFFQTFNSCNSLQLNEFIFYSSGEQSSRFAGKNLDFRQCFLRSEFIGIQGTAPDLWNCSFGSINSEVCFGGTGNTTTSITNYDVIPNEWKN
jgi:hypothetical protein